MGAGRSGAAAQCVSRPPFGESVGEGTQVASFIRPEVSLPVLHLLIEYFEAVFSLNLLHHGNNPTSAINTTRGSYSIPFFY